MKTMIQNLINGNIADARRGAKRFSTKRIVDVLCTAYGWEPLRAWKAANFLKTGEGWQGFCDAN